MNEAKAGNTGVPIEASKGAPKARVQRVEHGHHVVEATGTPEQVTRIVRSSPEVLAGGSQRVPANERAPQQHVFNTAKARGQDALAQVYNFIYNIANMGIGTSAEVVRPFFRALKDKARQVSNSGPAVLVGASA